MMPTGRVLAWMRWYDVDVSLPVGMLAATMVRASRVGVIKAWSATGTPRPSNTIWSSVGGRGGRKQHIQGKPLWGLGMLPVGNCFCKAEISALSREPNPSLKLDSRSLETELIELIEHGYIWPCPAPAPVGYLSPPCCHAPDPATGPHPRLKVSDPKPAPAPHRDKPPTPSTRPPQRQTTTTRHQPRGGRAPRRAHPAQLCRTWSNKSYTSGGKGPDRVLRLAVKLSTPECSSQSRNSKSPRPTASTSMSSTRKLTIMSCSLQASAWGGAQAAHQYRQYICYSHESA